MSKNSVPLVVHIIYALGTGGLENGLVNIINRTPRERYRHAIVCLTSSGTFSNRLLAEDVQIFELHKSPGHDMSMYWRLWKVLRRLEPDIIHSRNLAALETQVLGIFMPTVRRVHGEHGRDVNDLDGSNWKYRALRRILSLVIDRFITVSQELSHWLTTSVGIPRARVTQIYNGVDQLEFRPAMAKSRDLFPGGFVTNEEAIVVGTVGRLAEVKDQGNLLKAMGLILQNQPDWRSRLRLVFVGEGPMKESLNRTARKLGLSDIVWLAGDREDVSRFLNAMDVFVLCSLAEGISNTLLEAMATGLPIVATRTGGNPELIEDNVNGFLVPVADSDALAKSLQGLIESKATRDRMGKSGLDKIRKGFDWDHTVEAYLNVYDQVLNRDSRSGVRKASELGSSGAGAS